jgi:hypothetical protein
MEGAGGITQLLEKWAETINGLGMASFVLDSYSGRGITDTSKLDILAPMIDAYRALGVLAAHPSIDPKRIAIGIYPLVTVIVSNGTSSTLCANAVPTAPASRRPVIDPITPLAEGSDCAIGIPSHRLDDWILLTPRAAAPSNLVPRLRRSIRERHTVSYSAEISLLV